MFISCPLNMSQKLRVQYSYDQSDFFSMAYVGLYEVVDKYGLTRCLNEIKIQVTPAIVTHNAQLQIQLTDVNNNIILPAELKIKFEQGDLWATLHDDGLFLNVDTWKYRGFFKIEILNAFHIANIPIKNTMAEFYVPILMCVLIFIITLYVQHGRNKFCSAIPQLLIRMVGSKVRK